MDKKTYLDALSLNLSGKCTDEQVLDILADYSEFFFLGLKEGKSEEELSAEFGPPEQAARELVAESAKPASRSPAPHAGALCAVLGGLVTAVFLAAARFSLKSSGSFSVWDAALFPLLLQAVFSLYLRTAGEEPLAGWFRRIPAVQGALFAFLAAVLFLSGYEVVFADRIVREMDRANGSYPLLFTLVSCTVPAALPVLIVSGVLVFLSAARGHQKARWLLFADTAFFTILLNFVKTLSHLGWPYDGATAAAADMLAAVAPNLAAAALFFILRKTAGRRRVPWTAR